METIIITTQDNNTYKFTPAIKNASGDFSPCGFNDSIFAEGSTCKVFLALGEDKRRYLIKQYKPGFTGDESYETITDIMRRYNKQGDNYILGDIYTGVGCFENSKEKERLNYKVFKYREGSVLLPHEGRESIFTNTKVVYSTLLDFLSFLNTLKLLHAEMDGEAYIHCDIKLDNTFALKINSNSVVQLIDMDSVRSKKDLVKAVENGVPYNQLIPTTAKYYSNDDVKALCKLSGEDLQRCVNILDTTAAVKMLSEMLVGNIDYDTFKDDEVLDKNETLQNALYNFFNKGLWNDFPERFSNVDEMIQQLCAIVATISDSLPTTIQTEKLKAISQSPIINHLRDSYIKRHGLIDTKTRKDIFIPDLLNDIDTDILPHIQKKDSEDKTKGTINETALSILLREKSNYIISAQAGQGKSSSLIFDFLKNINNLDSDELYIYVPLANYSHGKSIVDFISDESRFDLESLLKNHADKITLLLDAFDEIKNTSENKIQNIEDAFWSELSKLESVKSIIITSKFDFINNKSNEAKILHAQFLPLDCNQIEKYLNKIDVDAYERTKNNESVLKLLSNTLFLTIFASLLPDYLTNIISISNETQLIETYFANLYEQKYGLNTSNSELYREMIQYIADYYYFGLERRSLIEERANCFASVVDFYVESKHWGGCEHKVSISHSIFQDYFIAVAIRHRLEELCWKVYNCEEQDARLFFNKSVRQLRDEIRRDIVSLAEKMYFSSDKSKEQAFDTFFGCFSPFFYKCLAYIDREATNDKCHSLELLYNFLLHEDFSKKGLNLFDISIFMRNELFQILSAYKSLELGRPVYDLKYYVKESCSGIGYDLKRSRHTKKNAAIVSIWITTIFSMLFVSLFGENDIVHSEYFGGVFLAILLLPVAFILPYILYRKFRKPKDIGKVEHIYVAPFYFETKYVDEKNINSVCYILNESIKRIVFKNGVKQIKGASFDGIEHVTSIWLPNTLQCIKKMNLSNCDPQIHYDGTVEQWQTLDFSECDSISCVFCHNGVFLPSGGTILLYYDPEIQNELKLSKKEFLFEFENFMKDKNSLTRIELIEELINWWEDRVNTDQNEIAEVCLACIYRLKNISDIEFENIKNTNLLFQFENI